MPIPQWAPDQAQFLLDSKQIRPDQYDAWQQTFGAPVTSPAAVPPTLDQAPALPAPPPPPDPGASGYNPFGAMVSGVAEAAVDTGREMLQQSAGGYVPPPNPETNAPQKTPIVPQASDNVGQNMEPAVPVGSTPAAGQDMAGLLSAQMQPFNQEQAAIRASANAAAAAAAEEQALLGEQQKTMQKQLDEGLKADAERQKYFDMEMGKLQKAEESVSKSEVNPDRFWADKGTGAKILAGIGMFLGAFGAAKTGRNPAVQVIQEAINRDIEQQKFDIQGNREGVQRKRGILGDMMAIYKDQTLARQAAQVQGMNIAQLSLQKIAAKYKGVESQQKAAMLGAQIAQTKQQYMAQFMDTLRTRAVMERLQNGAVMDQNTINSLPAEMQERAVGSGDMFYGFAPKTSAPKMRELLPGMEQGRGILKQLIDLGEAGIAGRLNPKDRAIADQLASMFRGANKDQIVGSGAISESEWKILNQVVGNPTDLFNVTGLDRLKNLQKITEKRFKDTLKINNLTDPKDARINALGGRRI